MLFTERQITHLMSPIHCIGTSLFLGSCNYSQHYIFPQGLMCPHNVAEISHFQQFSQGFYQKVWPHFLKNFFDFFPVLKNLRKFRQQPQLKIIVFSILFIIITFKYHVSCTDVKI
jgi:hypothetical protein